MKINFAELYGVKPGEQDFSRAINRSLEKINKEGIPHLNKNFIEYYENINRFRTV